jgi:hypothetical protein
MVECAKPDECNDSPMPRVLSMYHGGVGSNGQIGMIGIPFGFEIANSPFGGAWMLPSNYSSPCGRLENPANIVYLLDFLVCLLVNIIGNEAL